MAGLKRRPLMEWLGGHRVPISLALRDIALRNRFLLFLDQSVWVEMALSPDLSAMRLRSGLEGWIRC